MEILDNIPVSLELDKVLRRMQLRKDKHHIRTITQELLTVTRSLARPRAVYEVGYIDRRDGDSLEINGVRFTSRLLRINLDKVERVFPYIVTCGRELDEVSTPPGDLMRGYCLDVVKETVLREAIDYLRSHLIAKYHPGQLTSMTPGSLESWPLNQQPALFSIFDNAVEQIGVRLTESCLMIPVKSVSGIFFPTEINFESCQLCEREDCPSRRAPYDAILSLKYR